MEDEFQTRGVMLYVMNCGLVLSVVCACIIGVLLLAAAVRWSF